MASQIYKRKSMIFTLLGLLFLLPCSYVSSADTELESCQCCRCPPCELPKTTRPPTTAAPTIPAPDKDPAGYCKAVKENSRFPVGNIAESTCRQYVYCFVNNGVWSGQLYNCAANLYFNRSTRLCETNLPATCSS